MVLTGKQIKALAEFVGLQIAAHTEPVEDDILETRINISVAIKNGRKCKLAHFEDYPDEGCADLDDF